MAETHTSEITLRVTLDENRVPEQLTWSAQDGGIENEEAKAMLLSVWDHKNKESLKIDLWTKDMPLEEMKIFFHQSLVALSDTFMKATQDEKMTATMKDFCEFFAEKLELKGMKP
ncbi:MAG: gliding motility protein GldC [Bacteroidetes bacterium]|jgi:gliding motility-associated protein GldC|nr:MAG: gliding motility protein GldC [Bacteroidota bacterium]UCE69747.1 MAG: gliding motility protein GldC [Flavobacteriaceae bacterium]